MKWGWLVGMLLIGPVCAAEPNTATTLAEIKGVPQDWPKELMLKEEVSFKLFLNGKESGAMKLPAATAVDLIAINEDTIQVGTNGSTAIVRPEQTDFWERISAIRIAREAPAKNDPAASLQLPANSETADWYAKQIKELIDPWLAKYPKSALVPEMQERKAAFEAEAARVAKGEARVGDKWMAAGEFAAYQARMELTGLMEKIEAAGKSGDMNALQLALNGIEKYAKAEPHPELVRKVVEALNAMAPAMTTDNFKQALATLRSRFTPEMAEAEEKALAKLKSAAALEGIALEPVFNEIQKLWPGNEPANRFFLSKAPGILDQINAALAQGKMSEAARLTAFEQKMLGVLSAPPAQLDPLKKATMALNSQLGIVRELEGALTKKDFDRIMTATPPAGSEAIQKWIIELQAQVAKIKQTSTAKLDEAQDLLFHLKFAEANTALENAQDLWPENPDIASRLKMWQMAKIVGGIVCVFILLGIWGWFSSLLSDIRYKITLRKKMKEATRLPGALPPKEKK